MKLKLFGRTAGYYLFWAGAIYLTVGLINIQYKFVESTVLSMVWVLCLLIPLTVPPVADYFNMTTIWPKRKPEVSDYKDNVYNLPTPKAVPPMPKVEEPVENNKPCYQVGKTEDGRVTLRMGTDTMWSQVVMNNDGVDVLIAMLEAAKDPNG